MKKLDGHVPYFFVPGNHDYYADKEGNWQTDLSTHFPISKYRDMETFGGVYDREPDRMENSFHLFSAGSRNFLVLCLEFGPRRDVVRWANEVVSKHSDREAILVTHAFTYTDTNATIGLNMAGNKTGIRMITLLSGTGSKMTWPMASKSGRNSSADINPSFLPSTAMCVIMVLAGWLRRRLTAGKSTRCWSISKCVPKGVMAGCGCWKCARTAP
jgi:hypothetical protein